MHVFLITVINEFVLLIMNTPGCMFQNCINIDHEKFVKSHQHVGSLVIFSCFSEMSTLYFDLFLKYFVQI